MSLAVIGHTGFVGGTICRQAGPAECYNSQNIEAIRTRTFDIVVCAGAPGAKWKANRDAAADLASIEQLIANIRTLHTRQFVLISTIDVFPCPVEVDEDTPVNSDVLEPYGRHRYYLEQSVRKLFPTAMVVRLPGLFGPGLRKNFIYDLIHDNALHLTHHESTFQFYNMENLWADIKVGIRGGLSVVNFATAPVKAGDVAYRCFALTFRNQTEKPPVHYDMKTRWAGAFGRTGSYLYSAEYTFEQLRLFAQSHSMLVRQ